MRLKLSRTLADFPVIFKAYRSWVAPMSNMLKAGGAYFDSRTHHFAFAKDRLHPMLVLWIYYHFFPLRSVPHVYNSDYRIQSLP